MSCEKIKDYCEQNIYGLIQSILNTKFSASFQETEFIHDNNKFIIILQNIPPVTFIKKVINTLENRVRAVISP